MSSSKDACHNQEDEVMLHFERLQNSLDICGSDAETIVLPNTHYLLSSEKHRAKQKSPNDVTIAMAIVRLLVFTPKIKKS